MNNTMNPVEGQFFAKGPLAPAKRGVFALDVNSPDRQLEVVGVNSNEEYRDYISFYGNREHSYLRIA